MPTRDMPRPPLASLMVLVLAVGCTCQPTHQTPPKPPDTPVEPMLQVQDEPEQTHLVNTRRVVAYLPAGAVCPEPESGLSAMWSQVQVNGSQWGMATQGQGLTQAPRVCVYESEGDERAPFAALDNADPGTFVDLPGGARVGFDRAVIATSGISKGDMLYTFAARTDFQAGLAQGFVARDRDPARPRLVLLDTSPTGDGGDVLDDAEFLRMPGRDPHGYLLAHLVRRLTCPTGRDCLVEIASRQVMGLQGSAPRGGNDAGEEGTWGTLIDLARGIEVEVDTWVAAGRPGPLLLNLSLGWHPYFGGGPGDFMEIGGEGELVDRRGRGNARAPFTWDRFEPGALDPDVFAVLAALTRARCQGALIFAAAGNHSGGPKGRRGPLLPAAWQAIPDGKGLSCTDVGVSTNVVPVPLLVAVGAVGSTSREISNARAGSRPQLVAYGDHAFALSATDGPIPEPVALTGTSVAAAVVSATAAMSLAVRAAEPSDVVAALYALGEDVGEVAPAFQAESAFWRYGSSPGGLVDERPKPIQVGASDLPGASDPARQQAVITAGSARRISLCRTLEQLVPTGAWTCAPIDPATQVLPQLVVEPSEVDLGGDFPGEATQRPACEARDLHTRAANNTVPPRNLCPDLQFYSPAVSPWTFPQPGVKLCPFCFVDFDNLVLWIELDKVETMDSLTVLMTDVTGKEFSYSLPDAILAQGAGGQPIVVQLNRDKLPTNVVKAALTAVRDDRSVTMPLTIKPEPL
jgi:hypothetical protein